MKIIYQNIEDLIPYINNPRSNDHAVDKVASSIKNFGFKNPILVDQNNEIVAGHTRLKAAKKLNMKEVPTIKIDDLNEQQIKAFRIADNKVAEFSEWDEELLKIELEGLDDAFTGFDLDDLESLFDEDVDPVVEDDFEVEVPEEPISKRGDIWLLGRHRLMCGDSTSIDDVEKLMDGSTAKMLFTSPPYSDMREYEGGKDLSVDNITMFIAAYRQFTDYQCVNLGIQRKGNDIVQYWDEYIRIAKESGYKMLAWNVWDKLMCGSIGQQSAFFPIRHEWIFVFGTEFFEINQTWEKKEESINNSRPRKVRQADGSMKYSSKGNTSNKYKQMESVLPMHAELGSIRSLHPATFPVGLPGEYIKAMSDVGDIVIEPFCGSGTTLIACEQLDRCCYGMELEPKYVDVIVNRYINLKGTSEDVFLIRDGVRIPYKEIEN